MVQGLVIKQKKDRHWPKWLFFLAFLCLIGSVGWSTYDWYMNGTQSPLAIPVVNALPAVSVNPVTKSAVASYTVPAANPRYISIPSLGVSNTRVYPVGVTSSGELATPANIHDAAWYTKSASPGQGYGAVLIDAHNGGYAENGIFSNLHTLQVGALVNIERGDGKAFTYKVVSNVTMSLDEVNKTGMKEMMTSADPSKEGLSLITCAGNYVPRLGQFDKRIMVRAVRV